jgi:hypothetical protein
MKTLIENHLPNYSSKVLKVKINGEYVKFKITCRNYNSGFEFDVYIQTKNMDWAKVAMQYDIPKIKSINYIWSDVERMEVARQNIALAEIYIKQVFVDNK